MITPPLAGSFLVTLVLGCGDLPPGPELGDAERPRATRNDLELALFAREPDIVTPVALDVDLSGRVWVIESNTHFPQPGYSRHPSDRLLIVSDENGDGQADRFHVYGDGFQQSMGLCLRGPGKLLLATRRDIALLEDRNGDEILDETTRLARLETEEQYPHNGLSGFAPDGQGKVFFAIGENMGVRYRLTARDGSSVTGGPEGGSIFRMNEDGSSLERWAVGFWNPFHMALAPGGSLFAVDNDPDSRPPCRLLHVVHGGDYGYRRWLGRKGLHPFTAWNGELLGTLPMASGTGEAPSGIVWSDRAGWPVDLRGALLVTSWGDHRIEAHTLEQRGASYRSTPRTIVQGGEWFRPVGIAHAPDGSLYFSDWVAQDYNVHLKGRLWRLRPRARSVDTAPARPAPTPEGQRLAALEKLVAGERAASAPGAAEEILSLVGTTNDRFLEGIGAAALAARCGVEWLLGDEARKMVPAPILLTALRRTGSPRARESLDRWLVSPELELRREALRWIGEEKLVERKEAVEQVLAAGVISRPLLEAYLAARSLLAGEAPDQRDQTPADEALLALVRDESRPAALRRLALASLGAGVKGLDLESVLRWAHGSEPGLRREASRLVRSFAPDQRALDELLRQARDTSAGEIERREAVIGLAAFGDAGQAALRELSTGGDATGTEAKRALRLHAGTLVSPPPDQWAPREEALILAGGSPAEGEMLFFHPAGPKCSGCHSVAGRGGPAGPDLSAAGFLPRTRLLDSLRTPGREVAPQFAAWVVTTTGGPRTGVILGEEPDGSIRLGDASGQIHIPRGEILGRELSGGTLMPEGLTRFYTVNELADLMAYLSSLR